MKKTARKEVRVRARPQRTRQAKRRITHHHRKEVWKHIGKVSVIRDSHGHFFRWRKIRPYRKGAKARREWINRERTLTGKHVSIWRGKRRWEVYGTGSQLYDFIKNIGYHHAPRQRFRSLRAEDVEPEDVGDYWDETPEIES